MFDLVVYPSYVSSDANVHVLHNQVRGAIVDETAASILVREEST